MDFEPSSRPRSDGAVDLAALPPPPHERPPPEPAAGPGAGDAVVDPNADRTVADAHTLLGSRLVPSVTRHWPFWAAVAIVVGTLLARLWIQAYLLNIGVRPAEVGINEQGVIETARIGVGVAIVTAVAVVVYAGLVVLIITIPLTVPATAVALTATVVRGLRTGTWVSSAHPVLWTKRIIAWFGARRWFRWLAVAAIASGVLTVMATAVNQASDRVLEGDLGDDSWARIFWFAFPHRPQCVVVTVVGSSDAPAPGSDAGGGPTHLLVEPGIRYVWLSDHAGITTLLELREGAGPRVLRLPSGSIARESVAGPCRNADVPRSPGAPGSAEP